MHLIVGLGNPGDEYHDTRHNAGALFLDYLAKSFFSSSAFSFDKRFNSLILGSNEDQEKVFLAKPQSFMNLSGQAVQKITNYYHIELTHLLVVHDDLDIPLGKFRIDMGTGPLLHNGITSIEKILKSNMFYRVRIGIDNRTKEDPVDGERYVLERFFKKERLVLEETFPRIVELLKKEYKDVFPMFKKLRYEEGTTG